MCIDRETRTVLANHIDAFRHGEISSNTFVDSLQGFRTNDPVYEHIAYILGLLFEDCFNDYFFSDLEKDPRVIKLREFLERCSQFLRCDYSYEYIKRPRHKFSLKEKANAVLSRSFPTKFRKKEDPVDRILSGPWPYTEDQLRNSGEPAGAPDIVRHCLGR